MFVIILVFSVLFEGIAGTIDLGYLDETVDPCDDFYQFSCGNFGNYHVRPNNRDSLDHFSLTMDELIRIGKDILSTPKHHHDPVALKKAKAAYKACIKINETDELFYYQAPELQMIAEFGGMPLIDNTKLEKVSFSQIGEIAGKFGIHQIFEFMVRNFNIDSYAVLLFPDSADKPQMIRPETVKSYDEVLEESLRKFARSQKLLGTEDPLDVFVWTTVQHLLKIHGVQKSDEELTRELGEIKEFMSQLFTGGIMDENMVPPNDIATLGYLQSWTEEQFGDDIDINWVDYVGQHFKWANVNVTEDLEVFLAPPEFIYGILNLIRKTDPRVVKNFVLLKTILFMAPDSDVTMRNAFEEYYKSLGLPYYERSEYCTRKIIDIVDSASLSFAVASDFVHYHFDINKIPEAVKIISNTREAFKEALNSLEWLDKASRDAVTEKLNNIVVYLGYPDFVDNKQSLDHFYDNVRICQWDHYGNSRRIRAFKQAYLFSQLNNHDLWTYSPFEVNAVTLRASNRIISPLSMLEPNFLNGTNTVFDYSRYGSIIAHEFIHHFDTSGIKYNQLGLQEPLLSSATTDAFQNQTQCFVDQFNNFYVPEVDDYLNGSRTLDENMADSSGLKHTYAAFLKLIKNEIQRHDKSDKYTLEQQFFINYATGWCSDDSVGYLTNLVTKDEHSPNRYRVLGTLANMKEFSEAFSCPVGAKMNPENKCALW